MNPSSAGPVYKQDQNMVIDVPTDTLALSVITVSTTKTDMFIARFRLLFMILCDLNGPHGVIQNYQWDRRKARGTSNVTNGRRDLAWYRTTSWVDIWNKMPSTASSSVGIEHRFPWILSRKRSCIYVDMHRLWFYFHGISTTSASNYQQIRTYIANVCYFLVICIWWILHKNK